MIEKYNMLQQGILMCDFLTREEGWIEDQEQLLVEE